MHNVTDTYKTLLKQPHRVETVIQIGGNDSVAPRQTIPGTVYGENMLVSVRQKADVLNREAPGIGYMVARKLEITMINPGTPVAIMGRIVPYSRLVADSGTSEWIPKGIFYVDTRKKSIADRQAATIDITAYDAVMKASADYDTGNIQWPSTDTVVAADAAEQMGVPIDIDGMTGGFAITKPDEMTICEVLRAIAVLYGGNFTVDDCGILRLLPLKSSATVGTLEYATLKTGDIPPGITGVKIHDGGGKSYTAGTGDALIEAESPWGNQETAENALSVVGGYQYTAFSAKQAIIHPQLELGDCVTVGTATGAVLSYYNDMLSYVATIGAPEECEINRQYPYNSTGARAGWAARSAKNLAKTAIGNIIENYNQLIAALNGADGVPEDLAAGLQNYVRYDLKNGDSLASSQLFAEIGNKARAEIGVYAVSSGGTTKTFAQILADVITLQGNVEILGNLTIESGRLKVAKSILTDNAVFARTFYANDSEVHIGNNTVNITTPVSFASGGMAFGGNSYRPTEITSTTGDKTVLGQIRGA